MPGSAVKSTLFGKFAGIKHNGVLFPFAGHPRRHLGEGTLVWEMMRAGYILIVAVWAAIGCQEVKKCGLDSSRDYVLVGFYEPLQEDSENQEEPEDPEQKTVAFSLIYSPEYQFHYISNVADTIDDDTVTAVGLPLPPDAGIITYAFDTDSVNYLLTIEYEPHLRIYYDECDPVFSYRIDTAYSDQFDSIAVVFRPLNDFQPDHNLKVFF